MTTLHRTVFAICCLLLAMPAFAEGLETWIEVRSPNFIVLSNAGEEEARKTALQFEQIRGVFREHLTVAANRPSPVITLFAVKNEDSLRELLPEFWAPRHSHPAGVFFYRLGQFQAAVQLDARGLNPYKTIYHEYYHSLTLPYFPNLPLWLAEGLADFFGNTEVKGKEAHLGEADPVRIATLQHSSLIPLDVLFKVDRSSPYYNEENETSIFYAESWALTHYLMVGDRESHKPMLDAYLAALQDGLSPEGAAAKGFGDLGTLEQNLEQYVHRTSFLEMRGAAPAKISDKELTARVMTEAEVDAYRGGFEALRGNLQEARPLAEKAEELDPRLALAWQNLGLVQLFAGARAASQASFSQAIDLDPQNGLTRYLRAYLNYAGRPSVRNPQIEDDLRRAIVADPNFAPCYSLLAAYFAEGNENLPEALTIAQKGVALEPGSAPSETALAEVLLQMRRFDAAQAVAQRARTNATNPAERASAERLIAYLRRLKDGPGGNKEDKGAPLPDPNVAPR